MSIVDHINTFLKHENYYNGILCNNPKPYEGQAEPKVATYRSFTTDKSVEYSVVMPVHNQETIIEDIFISMLVNTTGVFEVIIICDACTDNTLAILQKLVLALPSNIHEKNVMLHSVLIISQETPIFETSCDNIGFRLAQGKYIIEIQADMKMIQYGYNRQLILPIIVNKKVGIVSGRGLVSFDCSTGHGKVDLAVEKPCSINLDERFAYVIGPCFMRGPIAIDKEKLKSVGYLDEQNFVLGDDDQDISARMSKCDWLVCYVPIEFYSPLSYGSTRKTMNEENKRILKLRKARSDGGELKNFKNKVSPKEVQRIHINPIQLLL